MLTFGRPITVVPLKSQPGVAAYSVQADGVSPLKGVWNSRAVDVAEDQGVMVSQVITLGIRLSEYRVPPVQEDHILVGGITYAVSDPPRLDGQGGADLTLKSLTPPP